MYTNTEKLNLKKNYGYLLLAGMIAAFIAEVIYQSIGVKLTLFPDSYDYLAGSKYNLFDYHFWAATKPPGMALLYKFIGIKLNNIVIAQIIIYLFSWLSFGLYFFKKSKNKIFGLICCIAVFYIALSPEVALWNYTILSESITFSILPLIFILTFEVLEKKQLLYLISLIILLGYFSTVRDVNAYYVLFFSLIIVIMFFYKKITLTAFSLSLMSILIFFAFSAYTSTHTIDTTPRWYWPLVNITGKRVLTNPSILNFFKSHGMPLNNALLQKKNFWTSTNNDAFLTDPNLHKFRDWLANHGKHIYTTYLVQNPKYTVSAIWSHRAQILDSQCIVCSLYAMDSYKYIHFFNQSNVIFYSLEFLAILAVMLILIIKKKPLITANTLISLSLLLPVVPLLVVCYHGDAAEVPRHCLPVILIMKLSLLCIFFTLSNQLYEKHNITSHRNN